MYKFKKYLSVTPYVTWPMTDSRRPIVPQDELTYQILKSIGDGEAIESQLYALAGSPRRIRPILQRFCELGVLRAYTRESGQRVPVYAMTDLGRLLLHVDGMRREIMGGRACPRTEEMSIESGDVTVLMEEYRDVRTLMSALYGGEAEPSVREP